MKSRSVKPRVSFRMAVRIVAHVLVRSKAASALHVIWMSAIVSATIALVVPYSLSVAAPIEGIKWQPGHYIHMRHRNDGGYRVVEKWLKAEPGFRGAFVVTSWRDHEKNTAGKYDFTLFDRYIDLVSQTDDYIFFGISDRVFGGTCQSSPVVPNDMTSWGQWALRKDGRACIARIHDPKVTDRYIQMIKAFADRYDDHPRVMGIVFSETAGNIWSDPTYTIQGKKAELIRVHQEMSKYMKHSIVAQSMNFLGSSENLFDLAEVISNTGVGGLTGPDMVPCAYWGTCKNERPHSYRVFEQYRSKVAILPEGDTSGLELGETMEVFNLTVDRLGAHMKFWKTHHRDSPDYFEAEVIPTLKKEKWRINTSCPTSFGECITDGAVVTSEPPAPTGIKLQAKSF